MNTIVRSDLMLTLCASMLALGAGAVRAQTTTLVSVDSGGGQGDSDSWLPSISADGRFVAFVSKASNLVPGDTRNWPDVFVHDRETGVTVCASVDPAGLPGDEESHDPSISADGRYVAFVSYASNLITSDTNDRSDVFVRDLLVGQTRRVSVDSAGAQTHGFSQRPAITPDGRFVVFDSSGDLAPGGGAFVDVFVRDLASGTTTLASVASNGMPGDSESRAGAIAADGSAVSFYSIATNLVPNDLNNWGDVFVRDLVAGTTAMVSVSSAGEHGDFFSSESSISGDGRHVAFSSYATNLVAGDVNATYDIFVHDRVNATTTLVSVDSSGVQGAGISGQSVRPVITPDARFVVFESNATNLVSHDSNGRVDVFLHDRFSAETTRISVASDGTQGDAQSTEASISADGRYIAFWSPSTSLFGGDGNGWWDVFVRDRGPSSTIAAFCFGDGVLGAPCPCGNDGAAGHGCGNSVHTGGALLGASGSSNPDTIDLSVADVPPGVATIYLQGDALAAGGIVFGDGLRCAAGQLVRLGLKNDTDLDGATLLGPSGGDTQLSVQGGVAFGDTRFYQTYYRNPDASWCPPATFNISNGLIIAWR